MNRVTFYAGLRASGSGLFGTSLSQRQVNGLERLLNVWEAYYASDPLEFLAYNLATSYHETGRTMQPVEENLNYSAQRLLAVFPRYFSTAQAAAYASRPVLIANHVYANRLGNGNEASGDGWRYRGEGDVQNTGRANAARATKELNARFSLGVDLVANPDKRGDPDISAHSLFLDNKEGWWTGRKLGEFIKPGVKVDFINARRVVNILDEAEAIARYAESFLRVLKNAGEFDAPRLPQRPREPIRPIPAPEPAERSKPALAAILALFAHIFKKG